MKIKVIVKVIALSAMAIAFTAQAHDPKEHMKDAQAPDCAAMKDMDHSKMDMDDPVTQAIMKKCMQDMHHDSSENHQHSDDHHSDKVGSKVQHPEQHEEHHPEDQPD